MSVGDIANLAQANGGAGTDVFEWLSASSSVNVSSLVGKVSNIEEIDLRDGVSSSVSIDLASLLSIHGGSNPGNALVLRLDSGDTLNIGGVWQQTAGPYTVGSETLYDYSLHTASTSNPADATLVAAYGT
jgi:hypothetical protein